MKNQKSLLIFLFLCFISINAKSTVIDLNLFYYNGAFSTTEESSYGATLYNLFLGFNLDRDGTYQIGWNYSGHATQIQQGSQTTDYSSTQMGPSFIYYLGRKRGARFGLSYNLVTEGTHKNGNSTEDILRGTSLNADIGYQFRFESAFSLGIRINYSLVSFAEIRQNSSIEDVSFSKSLIYPSMALTYEF